MRSNPQSDAYSETRVPGLRPGTLMHRLRSRAVSRRIPMHVMLELTDRCNLRCRHCYLNGEASASELSLNEYGDILTQLAQAGVLFLTLTGGEPMLRRDFFAIAEHARIHAFALNIFTNGTLIDEDAADRLRDLCPQRVEISILGGSAATHDDLTGVPGSFDLAVSAAKRLVQRGIRVQLKTTWMNANANEATTIIALADDLGASFRDGFLLLPYRNGDGSPDDLALTQQQLQDLVWSRLAGPHPIALAPARTLTEEQKQSIIPCGAGQASCLIDAHGVVLPCVAMRARLGDLRKSAFSDVWENSAALRELQQIRLADLPECGSCDLFTHCNRCAGQAQKEFGDVTARSEAACKVARAFEDLRCRPDCGLS